MLLYTHTHGVMEQLSLLGSTHKLTLYTSSIQPMMELDLLQLKDKLTKNQFQTVHSKYQNKIELTINTFYNYK